MRLTLFIFAFVLVYHDLLSQNLNLEINPARLSAPGFIRFNDPSLMGQREGAKIDYSDIIGNCFLPDQWIPFIIKLKNQTTIKFSKSKLNIYTGDIHYVDRSGKEFSAESKVVETIFMLDLIDTTKVITVCKKIDNSQYFSMILNQGKVKLIKKPIVTLFKGAYDASRGKNDYRFVQKIEYSLMKDATLFPLKELSKKSILDHLVTDEQCSVWLESNKNKLKKEVEVIQFLDYYNSKG